VLQRCQGLRLVSMRSELRLTMLGATALPSLARLLPRLGRVWMCRADKVFVAAS
jgi:hypothetical protein